MPKVKPGGSPTTVKRQGAKKTLKKRPGRSHDPQLHKLVRWLAPRLRGTPALRSDPRPPEQSPTGRDLVEANLVAIVLRRRGSELQVDRSR